MSTVCGMMGLVDADDDAPKSVGYLDSVKREDWIEPQRLMFRFQDSHKLYLCAVDLCDPEHGRTAADNEDELVRAQQLARRG
jgi:hypothetical protein